MTRGWPVELQSDEVRLRPLHRRDRDAWRAVRERNAAWLTPWEATAPPGTGRPASFEELVRGLRRLARQGQALPFVIEVDGRLVGQVTVSNIVRGSAQFASLGYWIDQRVAGRGIVPRAVAVTVDHCFAVLGLHRMEIAIRPENSNSLRVAEKLGLREVGYARRFLHIDGAWRDHRLFEIDREDVPRGLLSRLSHESQE